MANKTWYQEIFNSEQVTNLAVSGSGNKYIAESVMSYMIHRGEADFVFVNWSGLNRIDFTMPIGLQAGYQDPGAPDRITENSRYWTNDMAPWRDKAVNLRIEDKITRMMYQEKDYRNAKSQSLMQVINLQNFLKARGTEYLFCFMYDYTNQDFDHNHLVKESLGEDRDGFSTFGTVSKEDLLYQEIDQSRTLTPSGMDWALTQDKDYFKDSTHLHPEGYRTWAREMLEQYKIIKHS